MLGLGRLVFFMTLACATARHLAAEDTSSARGYTLQNINYGLNHVLSSHKSNIININIGQTTAQCAGKDCSTKTQSGNAVQNRINGQRNRPSARDGSDMGAETVIHMNNANSIWIKAGQGVLQCVGAGCDSSASEVSSIDNRAGARASSDIVSASSSFEKFRIIFDNVTIGEGNIINIGDANAGMINIGDGTSQCSGDSCSSKVTKTWSVSSSPEMKRTFVTVPTVQQKDVGTPLSAKTVTFKNMDMGEGNIINIGDSSVLSINIGDGAPQCIGDGCSSDALKSVEVSRTVTQSRNATMMEDGVIYATKDFPYTLVFKNLQYGYGNIINIGFFNEIGIVAGDGSSQCSGSSCSSSTTKSTSVINTDDSGNSSSRAVPTTTTAMISTGVDYPILLTDLTLGEGNIINIGDGNTLSINIGDGASQCVGDECSSTSTRVGNFSALPSNGGGGGGGGEGGNGDNVDPMKPSEVAVQSTTGTSAVLTWKDATASPSDQTYKVNCVPGSDTTCKDSGVSVEDIAPKTQKATVQGLSPGSSYECWVESRSVTLNNFCSEKPVTVNT